MYCPQAHVIDPYADPTRLNNALGNDQMVTTDNYPYLHLIIPAD